MSVSRLIPMRARGSRAARPALRAARPALRAASAILILSLFTACDDAFGPEDLRAEQRDLNRAWATWSNSFIRDYEYVVRHDCYCQLGGIDVRVSVQGGYVVSRVIDGTSAPLPGSAAFNYPTIDGLFGIIQDAIDTRARRVNGRYDGAYGFPTDIYIDYSYGGTDDTERYTLLAFRSLR